MENNDITNNILVFDNSNVIPATNYELISNINFNISLFIFIFVVYFLYTLLKDFFVRRWKYEK